MNVLKNINSLGSLMLKNFTSIALKLQKQNIKLIPTQSLWSSVDIAFNSVDADRLKLVGPDRLCAEWILKNGGGIRTVEDSTNLIKDYNLLPPEEEKFQIKEVDASGSSIMKIGLDHLKGCDHIDNVIMHECKHLEEFGLDGLLHLKNTLKKLEVSACDNIDDDGLTVIGELKKLDLLRIFDMRYVKNIDTVRHKLTTKLPKCHMDIRI